MNRKRSKVNKIHPSSQKSLVASIIVEGAKNSVQIKFVKENIGAVDFVMMR